MLVTLYVIFDSGNHSDKSVKGMPAGTESKTAPHINVHVAAGSESLRQGSMTHPAPSTNMGGADSGNVSE